MNQFMLISPHAAQLWSRLADHAPSASQTDRSCSVSKAEC
jgi:hypothetical protein